MKKIKNKLIFIYELAVFPHGVDKKFDESCKKSFYSFLRKLDLAIDFLFFATALTVFYFFAIY